MGAAASQITSLMIVYSTAYSDADQRKYQSSASLAFVWGIHRRPVNSPHKWPVTRKMFPFDDVMMIDQKEITSFRSRCRNEQIFMRLFFSLWNGRDVTSNPATFSFQRSKFDRLLGKYTYDVMTWRRIPYYWRINLTRRGNVNRLCGKSDESVEYTVEFLMIWNASPFRHSRLLVVYFWKFTNCSLNS